ncbi:hypothetical protein TRAPUB_8232 [Trametes pubescens]|uniref:Uncharacterized protein n=1 Tax=Trametes pubescens TaxID=154538 RepID=A0A1M2W5U9_TRAPU|nr:hypothetical protein TRAPUB_8232 [Trametes pubescens]
MNPTQCEPIQFTWQGGVPPYYLSLVPGDQPGATPLKQFPAQSGESMSWLVDFPADTAFSSSLRDSTGEQAFSDIQTVQQGPDSSCLNVGSSGTTAMTMASTTGVNSDTSAASIETATTASALTGAQKVISTAATSASATTTDTVAHAASSASTTSATATSSNAASLHTSVGAIGFAGLLGLVGAALLG